MEEITPIKDKNIITRTKTITETIDLNPLIKEKAEIEELLKIPEPSDEELIELGRMEYEMRGEIIFKESRLEEINNILKEYK